MSKRSLKSLDFDGYARVPEEEKLSRCARKRHRLRELIKQEDFGQEFEELLRRERESRKRQKVSRANRFQAALDADPGSWTCGNASCGRRNFSTARQCYKCGRYDEAQQRRGPFVRLRGSDGTDDEGKGVQVESTYYMEITDITNQYNKTTTASMQRAV